MSDGLLSCSLPNSALTDQVTGQVTDWLGHWLENHTMRPRLRLCLLSDTSLFCTENNHSIPHTIPLTSCFEIRVSDQEGTRCERGGLDINTALLLGGRVWGDLKPTPPQNKSPTCSLLVVDSGPAFMDAGYLLWSPVRSKEMWTRRWQSCGAGAVGTAALCTCDHMRARKGELAPPRIYIISLLLTLQPSKCTN